MTTMLEKMAEAMSDATGDNLTHDLYVRAARAALQAIREPEHEIINRGVEAGHAASGLDDVLHLPSAFTAMIDAILAEDKA